MTDESTVGLREKLARDNFRHRSGAHLSPTQWGDMLEETRQEWLEEAGRQLTFMRKNGAALAVIHDEKDAKRDKTLAALVDRLPCALGCNSHRKSMAGGVSLDVNTLPNAQEHRGKCDCIKATLLKELRPS